MKTTYIMWTLETLQNLMAVDARFYGVPLQADFVPLTVTVRLFSAVA